MSDEGFAGLPNELQPRGETPRLTSVSDNVGGKWTKLGEISPEVYELLRSVLWAEYTNRLLSPEGIRAAENAGGFLGDDGWVYERADVPAMLRAALAVVVDASTTGETG